LSYDVNTTLAPITVKRTKVVADLEAALADQRANRTRIDAIKGEGFEDLCEVLTGDQKEAVVGFIRSRFGDTPEEISKENAKQAEVRALTQKTAAQNADAPLVALLAVYANATNDVIELAPGDGLVRYLRWDGDTDEA
jgi:hypothetical protein